MGKYLIGIDQSTQGTKALLFDTEGTLLKRSDLPHRQIVTKEGWVSHDPMEIYRNTVETVKRLVSQNEINKDEILCVGICNQRETTVAWNKETGKPIADAIVWQCTRAASICEEIKCRGKGAMIRERTGLELSPYFPAAKMAWLIQNAEGVQKLSDSQTLCLGTIDSWLVFCLTGGKSYKTDYSNASRTQLFHLTDLKWDEEICDIFGINPQNLPEVCESNSNFGETDFDGFLNRPIPIHSVLGDSHGALFGQGCLKKGMMKTTYGTGSSIMMNIGEKPIWSAHGVVTSLAWGMDGRITYVLEGNINYTGAVITWLKEALKLIASPKETQEWAEKANADDEVYLVPAFTGLGAPYWNSMARGTITGIDRTTGKAEIIRAGLESIAYQITDIIKAMEKDAGLKVGELRVDGGPTKNAYLMQFQSDMLNLEVQIPEEEELSGIGAVYAAGLGAGIFNERIFEKLKRSKYVPEMEEKIRNRKYAGWLHAVQMTLEGKGES